MLHIHSEYVLFYYRYVDDLCAVVPSFEINSFFECFNSFHSRLQFTLEIGSESLNFLDITITIKDKLLIFDWYPLTFIFDTINNRIKNIQRRRTEIHDGNDKNDESESVTSWFTVPFIPSITDKFNKFNKFNRDDIKVSYYSANKLNKFIKIQKDPRPHLSRNNVVYKITRNDCDASYVGQTSRQLKTRIAEYRNHIRWNTRSVITEHICAKDTWF